MFSNLSKNDVLKPGREGSAVTVLLRQIVQLSLDGSKEINDAKRMIQRYHEESKRREEKFIRAVEDLVQSTKILQEQAKRHGMEPPLRSRAYRNEPYRLPRMPLPSQNPSSCSSFSPEETQWYGHLA